VHILSSSAKLICSKVSRSMATKLTSSFSVREVLFLFLAGGEVEDGTVVTGGGANLTVTGGGGEERRGFCVSIRGGHCKKGTGLPGVRFEGPKPNTSGSRTSPEENT
jgi:hypothetical protein